MSYKAFLSYSHAADGKLAPAVQSALQQFAKPWYALRALRVFRDKTTLSANPALWPSIERALEDSEFFLLLATPEASKSVWVQREVDWWLTHRSTRTFLILLGEGDIRWDDTAHDFDWERTTALPPLRSRFPDEPFYIDFRWAKTEETRSLRYAQFRDAILDLAAPLHGRPKDELDGEDVRQNRRTRRLAWTAVASLTVLAVALGIAAFYAALQRDEANRQADIARTQTKVAIERQREAEEQRRIAEEQRATALSRQLAAQASNDLDDQLDLALLQSAEAARIHDTRESRSTLLAALLQSPRLEQILSHGAQTLSVAAIRPDAKAIASVSDDRKDILLEILPGSQTSRQYRLRGTQKRVRSLAFSPDGGILAAGGSDASIVLWDLRKLRPLGTPLRGPSDFIAALTFSPDGKRLACRTADAGIQVWNLATRTPQGQPFRPKRWETALAFSPDGKLLVSGENNGTLLFWDSATGQPLSPPLKGHRSKIFSLAFSPDGTVLASASEDRTIILWDSATHQQLGPPLSGHGSWALGHDDWGLSVAFSPDGRTLASGAKDKAIILWDVASRQPLGRPLTGHKAAVMSLRFSADGKTLISVGQDDSVLRWNVAGPNRLQRVVDAHAGQVLGLTFSQDGKALASGGSDGDIRLWNPVDGKSLGEPLLRHSGTILDLAFSKDGRTLTSVGEDGRIVAWNLLNRQAAGWTLSGHQEPLSRVALGDGGRILATSDGSSLSLWDVPSRRAKRLPIGRASGSHLVYSLSFSPGGDLLVSGGFDGTLAFWDAASGQLLGPALAAHSQAIRSLAFTRDGSLLASAAAGTADFDENVRLWDVKTRRQLTPPLNGHRSPVGNVAFNPDGKTLASAALEDIVLWDIESRQPIGSPFKGDAGVIWRVEFSPDGNWLAWGGADGSVILWDLRLDSWLAQACAVANRNLTNAEWTRVVGDLPYRRTCPQLPAQ